MDRHSRLIRSIAERLLAWYDSGHRDLPWRRTADPYRIWVSEIMLQQTRAQAVIPYFERFLARFPDAAALARAPEQEVLAAWSGLGYYSRARNMHKAALQVAAGFPRDYESLLRLPGIGGYTAAAIGSIAFNLPHVVLDGNVMRVVARVTNDASDISSARTRARFREIAQSWLDRSRPGAFNQAIMELGAVICLPRNPLCPSCPIKTVCEARHAGRASELPVKLRRTEPVHLAHAVAVVKQRTRILLWQRPAGSRRLAGFWELPSAEHLPQLAAAPLLGSFRHTITHHRYRITVHAPEVSSVSDPLSWTPMARLPKLPLSTIARKALRIAGVATK